MVKLTYLFISFIFFLFSSCKSGDNTYAIKDFRKSLQPFLAEIASEGMVTFHEGFDIKSITDDELILLSKSDNPILRATALGEMLDRKTFSQFNVVMDHLDDTAIVAVDNGEFGISFDYVSDYLLEHASWETLQAKNKTIEKVLTKHNYLSGAYTILSQLQAQEKFYRYIKDMATRPRYIDKYHGYELRFNEIEYALYGLAKFKKKEDVQIIKDRMMKEVHELSDVSFKLMEEFPDTGYIDVLREYHRRQFYMFSGNRPHGFTGMNADRAAPEDFIRALVVQQNDRSAKLLDTMLTYLPKVACMPDRDTILEEVITQIWDHPCPAYVTLREKIRQKAEKLSKSRYILLDDGPEPIDTTKRVYYWH